MRGVHGISQRMLTTTLRYLERDGIVSRHIYPEVPPRVEYALTKRGLSLLVPVSALVTWVEAQWPDIQKSRADFDAMAGQADVFSAHLPPPRSYA
jgi:DNA-binding HxlR family transcriptional regulator